MLLLKALGKSHKEIVNVEEKLNTELKQHFEGFQDGFVQVGEKKWFYPKKYEKLADEFKNFEVRPDDIWITGYPRSGTTMTENLVWLMSNGLDFEQAKKVRLSDRVKLFELSMLLNDEIDQEFMEKYPEEAEEYRQWKENLKTLKETKNRRIIKTHLPFELLPPDVVKKQCKTIYICRSPKDVCVSLYKLQISNRSTQFVGTFEQYWKYFKDGHIIYGPYFEHLKQGYDRIGSKNFMFVYYEDFNQDNAGYIERLSDFLEVPLTDEKLDALEEYISMDYARATPRVEMKDVNNHQVDDFVGKGRIGDWNKYFTEEMVKEADEWIGPNVGRIGITYPENACI